MKKIKNTKNGRFFTTKDVRSVKDIIHQKVDYLINFDRGRAYTPPKNFNSAKVIVWEELISNIIGTGYNMPKAIELTVQNFQEVK